MAFKLRSGNNLSFKSMGSSPAKQKMKNKFPPKQLEILPFEGIKPDYPTFKEKNPRLHERRLPSLRPINPVTPAKQKTDSKVVSKNAEITIAANKKAAEIGKRGNKGKKTSDYTPAELALIKNPAYQKALNLALDKVMKDNPDTTGQ